MSIYQNTGKPIIRIELSNLSQMNSFQIGLLINSKGLEKVGYSLDPKTKTYLWIRVNTALKDDYLERANALKEILSSKGFKTDIYEKIPKKIDLKPINN